MVESFLTKQALELFARMIQHEKDWIEYQFQFKPPSFLSTDPLKWAALDKDCELLEQFGKLIPATTRKPKHVYQIPRDFEIIHQFRKEHENNQHQTKS